MNINDYLSSIINYFLPGYLLILIFSALTQKKFGAEKIVMWSYIWTYLSYLVVLSKKTTSNSYYITLACFLLCILTGIVSSMVFRCKWFKKLLAKIFKVSLSDDMLNDILQLSGDNLIAAVLYLKDNNTIIAGDVYVYDSKYIGLKNYIIVNKKCHNSKKRTYVVNNGPIVIIDINNILYMKTGVL